MADAWINWIGVLPAVALLDDAFLAHFLPRAVVEEAALAEAEVTGSGAVAASKRNYSRLATDEATATNDESESDGGSSTMGRQAGDPSTYAAAPPVSIVLRGPFGAGARVRMYRSSRTLLHLLLAGFIACKSAAPLLELFTPAPWLHFYDDWFFVNAQGVFGFINSHRVNLVLTYTHDPLPPGRSQGRIDPSCRDSPGSIANAADGRALACSDLAAHCASHGQLRELCPKTCGQCGGRSAWLPSAVDALRWRPLEFKNLPGEPTRRPFFNSPYHYRLDWETWIHVTASMEHIMSQRLKSGEVGSQLDLPVPRHIQVLLDKVLLGDTDSIHLLGTPPEDLLWLSNATAPTDRGDSRGKGHGVKATAGVDRDGQQPMPPTAIKAEFYSYKFSSWDGLLHQGRWWDRELLSRPVIFERSPKRPRPSRSQVAAAGNSLGVRRTPWQRHWLLLGASVGMHLSIRGLLGLICSSTDIGGNAIAYVSLLNHMAVLLIYGLVAALALLSDYPNSDITRRMSSSTPLHGFSGIVLLLPAFAILAPTQAVTVWRAARAASFETRESDSLHAQRSVLSSRASKGIGGGLASVHLMVQYVALPAALFALARGAIDLHAKLLLPW